MTVARLLAAFIATTSLAPSAVAFQQVFTVDDDGPADFTDVQAAIDASNNGAAILIAPGAYSGFEIVNKGLRVVGTKGTTLIEGTVTIRDTQASRVVALSNLKVMGQPSLELSSNNGHVRVQSSGLIGKAGVVCECYDGDCWFVGLPAGGGIVVEESADVAFVNSTIEGGTGNSLHCEGGSGQAVDYVVPGTAAVITDSAVAFYNTTVVSPDSPAVNFSGPDGRHGAIVTSSVLFTSGATFDAGRGSAYNGPAGCPGGVSYQAGNGGAGIRFEDGDSVLYRLDSEFFGGAGGTGRGCHPPGIPGFPFDNFAGSAVIEIPETKRLMDAPHLVAGGSTVILTLRGKPGDTVYLPTSNLTDFTLDLSDNGVWFLDPPPATLPAPIGEIPSTGPLTVAVDLPGLGPNQQVRLDFFQPLFVDDAGRTTLGPPGTTTVIDTYPGPQVYCQTAANSAGDGALIHFSGSTSIAQNNLTLLVTEAPPSQFGIFFYGAGVQYAPFGDGQLCVAGQVFRLPVIQADLDGSASFATDYGQPPMSQGSGEIAPGTTYRFQFWYRDPTGPGGNGFNLSDGLHASFFP